MYNLFWIRITDILKASFFGRVFLAIARNISGAFKASAFYSFFASKSMERYGENSKIFCFLRKLFFKTRLFDIVSDSVLIWAFSEMPKNVFNSSLSLLSAFILPAGILLFISSFGIVSNMIISAIIILIGIMLLSNKALIKDYVNGSVFFSVLCKYFEIDTESQPTKNYKKRFYFVLVMFGVLVGLVAKVLGFNLALLLFGGILFLPLLISSPMFLLVLTYLLGVAYSSLPAFAFALLTLVVVLSRLYKKLEHLPKLRTPYILVLLYSALLFYFTIAGRAGSDSMLSGFTQFILISVFFSVTVTITNFEKFRKLIFSITVCSIYPCLVGIYQLVTGQGGTGWTAENHVGGLARITSTFMNPNVFGEFLIFSLCICAVAIFISKNLKQGICFFGIFILQVVNLALTYSRGCYLSVVVVALVAIWFCDARIMGFGIFALPAIPYVIPENIVSRMLSVGEYLEDTSALYRFSIWKGSLDVIKNHWFVGAGVGSVAFSLFYHKYMLRSAAALHAHNTYMQITIELSLVGLILFLLILLYSVKDVCYVMKTATFKAKLAVIPLMASFAGILIQCFFDHIFYNNIIFMMYWLVLGLVISGLNIFSSDNRFISQEKVEV